VPLPIALPVHHAQPGLCVGGELKNTVAVVRDGQAILSHHLGDLTHALAFEYFNKAIDDLQSLFGVQPQWIAHDLHPVYLSTARATALSKQAGVPLIGVQHHHAHAAAVMAEHGQTGPVLAVVCDGTGYGDDQTVWGGELLLADLVSYQRLARLKPLRLPGGDAAARDTRRCALALLHQTLGSGFDQHPAAKALLPDAAERAILAAMIRKNVACAVSSGTGRLFDAVAALLGLCMHNDFEAQAALALEAAASDIADDRASADYFAIEQERGIAQITLAPLIRLMIEDVDARENASRWAAAFHDQLAYAWDAIVADAAEKTATTTVALSGGVFCNQRLTHRLTQRLTQRGFKVLTHQQVPANDGGLSLGQAAIATAQLHAQRNGKAGL
jgi:hydrogenase maturation protein HypF